MKPTIHELKTIASYYDAVERGEKLFEVRRDDRGYQRGDIVALQRCYKQRIGGWKVETDISGKPVKEMRFRIGWILTGGQFGIEPGYVVFSLESLTGRAAQ